MALGEHHRYVYLQKMGIDVYYPRFPLPGAKPSAGYAKQVRAAPQLTMTGRTDHARRVFVESIVDTASAPLATAAPARPSEASVDPVVIAPEMPTPEIAKNEDLRFVFAYFPVSDELAVINEIPWANSTSLSPVSRKMLADMLKALSLPCEERDLKPMLFTWPLFDAPGFDLGGDSARHTLEGFLAKRLKLRPVRHLLVLAEQSTEYIFPADYDWQTLRGRLFAHPRHDVQLLLTRSLSAMEAVPELKRSVWQALQPLRTALANKGDSAVGQADR
jgi:hypothetical protein